MDFFSPLNKLKCDKQVSICSLLRMRTETTRLEAQAVFIFYQSFNKLAVLSGLQRGKFIRSHKGQVIPSVPPIHFPVV